MWFLYSVMLCQAYIFINSLDSYNRLSFAIFFYSCNDQKRDCTNYHLISHWSSARASFGRPRKASKILFPVGGIIEIPTSFVLPFF